jgi:pheromone shutdown-related protein TraB
MLHKLEIAGSEVLLLGTAHISQESVEAVQAAIEQEQPSCVCVELDSARLKSLESPSRWESLDLKKIIREGQLASLIANLVLSSYQKRMGLETGVAPGSELKAAVETARGRDIEVALIDRDAKATLRRAWALTPFFRKFKLLAMLLATLFEKPEQDKLTEDALRDLRESDTLSSMMDELGAEFPEVKSVLITERDQYLASRLRDVLAQRTGQKILAVVGAGHIPGIESILKENLPTPPQDELSRIPPTPVGWKVLGWALPIAIVASIVYIGVVHGSSQGLDMAFDWVLLTGVPAAFGTLCALAHPLVVMAAFFLAPLTTLHPLLGVGMFTALFQCYLCPPRVFEMERVAEDLWQPSRWWKNRFTRVLLAFLLPGLPTTIGSLLGITKIAEKLLE